MSSMAMPSNWGGALWNHFAARFRQGESNVSSQIATRRKEIGSATVEAEPPALTGRSPRKGRGKGFRTPVFSAKVTVVSAGSCQRGIRGNPQTSHGRHPKVGRGARETM